MTEKTVRPQLAHLTATLNELKAKGTYFRLRVLDDQQAPVCHYDGKEVINLASNNYLGLANHPKLIEAAVNATKAFGVGSGAVRTIAGTMKIHMELEEKIARFKNVEACVVFQSGFAANAGTVSAILGKEDFILSDELNHAGEDQSVPAQGHGALRGAAAGGCRRAGQKAGDYGWRLLDGRGHWASGPAGSTGGEVWGDHDGGRCSCFGSAGAERARKRGPLWHAWQGGCTGGDA